MDYVRLASVEDIAPGKMACFPVGAQRILVANVDGVFHAVDDQCTHEEASLSMGWLQDEWVGCPLHGSCFNVRTGEVSDEPAETPLRCYPVRIEGDSILVDVTSTTT